MKDKISIGFVILHYVSIDETVQCIESIQNLKTNESFKIVVIDNASPNGTGEILKNKYRYTNNIEVILLEENFGFSKANNLAAKHCIEQYNIDFLVVANNDIIFIQEDFIERIIESFKEEEFYVLGPDVYAFKVDKHQNPLNYGARTEEEIDEWIKWSEDWYNNTRYNLLKEKLKENKFINNVYRKFKPIKSTSSSYIPIDKTVKQKNMCLQGSCLIFSKLYLNYYQSIFYPETFFYHEEDILAYKLKKNNHLSIYDPKLIVYHDESIATSKAFKNKVKKLKFQHENMIKSANIYRNLIINDKNNK